jgi:hypothetical protein
MFQPSIVVAASSDNGCDVQRALETGLIDHRRDVVRPDPPVAVVLGLGGLLRQAVAPDVERDHPEPARESAADLLRPARVALRPAVDEEDRAARAVAPLARVQPYPAATADLVRRDRLDEAERRRLQREIVFHGATLRRRDHAGIGAYTQLGRPRAAGCT